MGAWQTSWQNGNTGQHGATRGNSRVDRTFTTLLSFVARAAGAQAATLAAATCTVHMEW